MQRCVVRMRGGVPLPKAFMRRVSSCKRLELGDETGDVGVWLNEMIVVKVIICTILIDIGVLQIVVQHQALDALLFGALRFLLVFHSYGKVGI